MHIRKKDILSYTLLPQIFPRCQDLFASGFTWFAVLIATIYGSVGLLPRHHPYLHPDNQGKFGVRQVIAAAATHLTFDRRHLDQILIFVVILCGVILLFAQIFLLIFGFIFTKARAAGVFETLNPDSDSAFMLLDYVFGIPGFFGSCALGTPLGEHIAPCENIPAFGAPVTYPFHAGLHILLEFYSWAILFVGILIFLYFIVVVLGETASSGSPFGARFNTIWAPVRLLVGIGLLIPVAYGMNSGQYLTLAVAKLGSGLATNSWLIYNQQITAAGGDYPNPAGMDVGGQGGNAALLPRPNAPDVSPYIAATIIERACEYGYMKAMGFDGHTSDGKTYQKIRPWLVQPNTTPIPLTDEDGKKLLAIDGSVVSGADGMAKMYEGALEFFNYGDIVIRFGAPDPLGDDPDNIIPYCGEITIPTTSAVKIQTVDGDPAGAWGVQISYFGLVMFATRSPWFMAIAARYAETRETGMGPYYRPCMITNTDLNSGDEGSGAFDHKIILESMANNETGPPDDCMNPPSLEIKAQVASQRQALLEGEVIHNWKKLQEVADLFALTTEVKERGWAAAGMWYNRIAFIVGREADAVINIPRMSKYPLVMEEVKKFKGLESVNVPGVEIFNPQLADQTKKLTGVLSPQEFDVAQTLYHVNKDWANAGVGLANLSLQSEKNVLISAINSLFGTRSLVSVREEENRGVHPMAQLVAIGKDLVNSTIINVMAVTGLSFAGGAYEAQGQSYSAGTAAAAASALNSIALVGLTAGFLLYYVLPFMPFLYFFFAVGTWIKGIFEAMVGVPLWALAHLRIDKDGLPGEAATNGYYLLLEILLRPILCVFGLVASFIIFGAVVRVLNEIFTLVAQNVMGFDDKNLYVDLGVFTITLPNKRAAIDEFFFTIMYTLLVYIIGLSCFKMIDMIPKNILRWIGSGAKSFGDTNDDPAENLTQYAAVGGYTVGQRLIGGIKQGGTTAGQTAGAAGVQIPSMPMYSDELDMVKMRNGTLPEQQKGGSGQGGSGGTP